ncbi:MAG: CatB-related O-acetyltransferase [Chitinophagaceae bacterium]
MYIKLKKIIGKILYKLLINFKPEFLLIDNIELINSYFHNSSKGEFTKLNPVYKIYDTKIGNYTYLAENAIISNATIGSFCSIGPNFICGWGIHPITTLSTAPMFYSTMKQNGITLSSINKIDERQPINIGNDVFIGMNVSILDGVTIGDGAVIGAGAVVSKDIPPYAVAIGCPIKIVKYRFDDDTIEKLLKIKWWQWKDEDLQEVEKHFNNVEEFIKKHYV